MDTISPYAVLGTHMFTLVDRALTGGAEIIADGQRITYAPGETSKVVSPALVEFLFRREQQKVWTLDGEFVQRFAVESPPQFLIDTLGPEVGDCSPIEIDTSRLERSDTSAFATRTTVRKLSVPPGELREKQGAGASVGTL